MNLGNGVADEVFNIESMIETLLSTLRFRISLFTSAKMLAGSVRCDISDLR
jgi:hypothetical protein